MSIDQKLRENVKLVYQVINDLVYIPEGVDKEDLEQIGKIALWKAIEDYDENSKYAMSTCCYRAIYRDIIAYLRRHQRKKRNGQLSFSGVEQDFSGEVVDSLLLLEIQLLIGEDEYSILFDKVVVGLTYDELVIKYGLSKKKLRTTIEKAKQVVRDNIKWEE